MIGLKKAWQFDHLKNEIHIFLFIFKIFFGDKLPIVGIVFDVVVVVAFVVVVFGLPCEDPSSSHELPPYSKYSF